ncbi:MAG: ABC transporter substrate-binding protein [Actinomycetota bacterium]|nr:ABC transporter substrate-binding protein [Actinomycetota bacterium]MDQ2981273.1 ABC transporter substrate-binding protein [Actinomycetota bacterium]
MRKRSAAVAALLLAALLVAGCGGSKSSSSAKGGVKEGGTLRLGTSSRIDSLNPYVAFNQDAYTTFMYIYPFLVQYDQDLNFAPDFAKSWETSKDGLTWTFHTVPNSTWSDGKPLTAADAAWTINADVKYQGTGGANTAGLIAHIKSASAPDANTLVVKYEKPVGNVLSQFQQLAILPKHVWARYTGHKGADLKTFPNAAPVVSGGAFVLTKFTKDQIALYKRNPNFYGPKPHIEGFGLRMFSNDDALVSAMKSGEIDAIESVPPTAIATLKKAGVVVTQVPGVTTNDFIFNANTKKKNNRELLNLKLREAFAHAIDRDKINKVVWLDTAKSATSFIPPSTGDWHNPNLQPESFDLAEANRLLDEVGYRKGSDGIRAAEGHKMSYEVVTPNDLTGLDRTFQIIQADFRKIGVELKQKSLDSSAAFEVISGPDSKYLNFDLAMWDWVPLIDPDFMLSVVTCDQYGGWSDSGYCNKAYDGLYSSQGTTLDQAKRREIVWNMQEKLFSERPYIMINYESWISSHGKRWDGFVSSPQGPFNSLSKESLSKVHQTS